MAGLYQLIWDVLVDILDRLFGEEGKPMLQDIFTDMLDASFRMPSESTPGIDTMVELNAFFQEISLAIMGILATYLLIRVGTNTMQSSQAMGALGKMVIGSAVLTLNDEILFGIFEITDLTTTEIFVSMSNELGESASQTLVEQMFQGILYTSGVGVLFKAIGDLIATISLGLFIIVLMASFLWSFLAVAVFPLTITAWVMASMVGGRIAAIPAKLISTTLPAIVVQVPLALILYIGLVIRNAGILPVSQLNYILAASTTLGGVWFAIKWTKVGGGTVSRIGSGIKMGALAGTALAVGGTSMLARVGTTKAFGLAGRDLSQGFMDEMEAGGGGGGGVGDSSGASGYAGMSDEELRNLDPEDDVYMAGPDNRDAHEREQDGMGRAKYGDVGRYVNDEKDHGISSPEIVDHSADRQRGTENWEQRQADSLSSGGGGLGPAPPGTPALGPGVDYVARPPGSVPQEYLVGGPKRVNPDAGPIVVSGEDYASLDLSSGDSAWMGDAVAGNALGSGMTGTTAEDMAFRDDIRARFEKAGVKSGWTATGNSPTSYTPHRTSRPVKQSKSFERTEGPIEVESFEELFERH